MIKVLAEHAFYFQLDQKPYFSYFQLPHQLSLLTYKQEGNEE